MKELVNKLNEARKAYYFGEQSPLSDREYDALYDRLVSMEVETGIILPGSPTQEVGYTVVSELSKVKHEQKALSLDKTKDVHFLETWLGTQDGVLSWKMDGMTVVATYENGQLIMAATRGNGEIGENVTHNARCIKGLPMKIRETGKVIVRGECILSYNDFEKIKESENGEYKNPRNLANASLRLYDSKKASTRHLQFKAFTLVECPKMPKTVEESFHWMEKQGFTVVEYKKVTAFTIKETITDYFEKEVESYTFPTDGLVLCMDDIAYGVSLGVTNKFPRNSIAFKWQDDSVETTLTDVIWSPSRTGLINPVALFKPVEIEGTMVTKASLHNLSYLSLLQLGYGDTITIYKANKIIPQVDENLTMNGNYIKIPAKCPACKQAVTRRFNADKSSEFLYCENPKCPAKHIGKYTRLVERDALNVTGIAKSAIETFVKNGFLMTFADLYHLDTYKEQIVAMDGFGEKSYNNMIKAIEQSRNTTFRQLFYALGIPGVGHDVAKILQKELAEPVAETLVNLIFSENALEKLMAMNGIGKVNASSIINWFKKNIKEYTDLCAELNIQLEKENASDETDLSGKIFVITGTLTGYPNRKALKEEIERRGGKVAGSISSKTTYLINNDILSISSKNKKAKEFGIPIISEEIFKTL